jgi:isopenicillin N synthase-like dioxygenase
MSIPESNSAKPKFYTQEDIQEILQIAIARQTDESDEAFTKEQLLEIAMELGIDATDITQAEKTWVSQQNINQKQQEFQLYRRSKLQKKLTRFIVINSLFVSTNLIFVGYVSWSLYIISVWGINIAIAAWKTYQTEGEEYQQELQKWQRDRDIKKSLNNIWTRIQQAWQI